MREYPIKRGHYKHIEGNKLRRIMEEIFGHVEEEDGHYITSYGSLRKIEVWVKDKTTLVVRTEAKENYDKQEALETLRKYNRFLDLATGYTAKQRAAKLKKEIIKSRKSQG